MKKFLGILLALVMLACSAFVLTACDDGNGKKGGLQYKKHSGDEGYTVYGFVLKKDDNGKYIDLENDGVLDIQKIIGEGKTITKIDDFAFKGLSGIKKIIIPDTVKEIGQGVFAGMTELKELDVPFIGRTAVADSSTSNPTASSSEKSVGFARTIYYWFATNEMDSDFCSVSNDIYDEGTTLSDIHFDGSDEVSTIYFPMNLETLKVNPKQDYTIPMYACYGNSVLVNIEFNDKVKGVGDKAFDECGNLSVDSNALINGFNEN